MMLKKIDAYLNKVTMYRFLLYFLEVLLGIAAFLALVGLLPFSPVALAFSTFALLFFSWITNVVFAWVMGVETNVESAYITALILALIVAPPAAGAYADRLPLLFWLSVLAMGSKYILNIKGKHIFNPAALAVAITALTLNKSADWWIGTAAMLPFVAIGGLMMARKVRRFSMFFAFAATAVAAVLLLSPGNYFSEIWRMILESPLVFFGAVMLTEPLTMPPTRDGQLAYGILVGWLFSPFVHVGSYYFTPETALLVGNFFSYVISPKGRHILHLVKKEEVGMGIYDFVFRSDEKIKFKPGQYMEWTLGHKRADDRGNRRYFTIASSPTENQVLLGVRFYPKPSTYKQKMLEMQPGDSIAAGSLAGDFTLPVNKKKKLVFVAGGIGITPFRSMLKYLVDKQEKRDIVVFYTNRLGDEIVYDDVLYAAWKELGVKVVATLTDKEAPADWRGMRGRFTPEAVRREIPDYAERTFYVSGSQKLVDGMKETLQLAGVARGKIKTDFFPGLT